MVPAGSNWAQTNKDWFTLNILPAHKKTAQRSYCLMATVEMGRPQDSDEEDIPLIGHPLSQET